MGFLAPAIITGKILLREISPDGKTWDEPLSAACQQKWELWKQSFKEIEALGIPRMYVPSSLTQSSGIEIHIFCDASEKAVASVAYVKITDPTDSQSHLGFIMGKAKVAPLSCHTIPRLELCSALLATEVWQLNSEQLDVNPKTYFLYR